MAFANAFNGEVDSFKDTVFFEGQDAVFGARRVETTARAYEGADRVLVEANKPDEEGFHEKFPCFVSAIFGIILSSSLLRKWWNWQTRYLEVVVRVISLGGSSPPFRKSFRPQENFEKKIGAAKPQLE